MSARAGSVAMLLTDSKALQNTGDGVVSILSAGNNLNQGNGVAGAPNGAFALK